MYGDESNSCLMGTLHCNFLKFSALFPWAFKILSVEADAMDKCSQGASLYELILRIFHSKLCKKLGGTWYSSFHNRRSLKNWLETQISIQNCVI